VPCPASSIRRTSEAIEKGGPDGPTQWTKTPPGPVAGCSPRFVGTKRWVAAHQDGMNTLPPTSTDPLSPDDAPHLTRFAPAWAPDRDPTPHPDPYVTAMLEWADQIDEDPASVGLSTDMAWIAGAIRARLARVEFGAESGDVAASEDARRG
jgi:hypothetical protein